MTEEQTAGQTPQAIDLMQFVPKVHFEQIPIRNLVSNQEYQRNLSQHAGHVPDKSRKGQPEERHQLCIQRAAHH